MEKNSDGAELQVPLFVQVKEEPNSESDGDIEENSFESNDTANGKSGCVVKIENPDASQDFKSEEPLGVILTSDSYGDILDNSTEAASHTSPAYQNTRGVPDAAREDQPRNSGEEKAFTIRKQQKTHDALISGKKGTETISLRRKSMKSLGKSFICNICEKSFAKKYNLVEHEGTHTGERPFKCSHCDATFARAHHKDVHERRHTGERPFACKTCNKTFAHLSSLDTHTFAHTEDRPFVCASCGATFKRNLDHLRHMRAHSNMVPYKCSVCHKGFNRKSQRDDHERTHTRDRPFHCSECDASFTWRQTLKEHKLTHLPRKSYDCHICKRQFRQNRILQIHIRGIHMNDKPFVCETCGKSFAVKQTLSRHQKKHTGVKNYKCRICGKLFYNANDVSTHEILHRKEKSFNCAHCNKYFHFKYPLKKHILTTHMGLNPGEVRELCREYSVNNAA